MLPVMQERVAIWPCATSVEWATAVTSANHRVEGGPEPHERGCPGLTPGRTMPDLASGPDGAEHHTIRLLHR
jgi:hypothetical protein